MVADVSTGRLCHEAPWREDLTERTRSHLRLDAVTDMVVREADVVVIGAGVTGLSAAIAARAAGAAVLVLEAAERIGVGATGRNAGILSAGVNMPLADLRADDPLRVMWPETTRLLLELIEEAQRPDSLVVAARTGAVSLAERPSAARHLAREARARTEAGLRAEMWTPAHISEATDGRLDTRGVVAALWLPDEGRIHPLTLLAHLARQARAAGVRLVGNARVAAIEETHSRGAPAAWRLRLATGEAIRARAVVNATGPTATPNRRIYALAFAADLPDDFPLFWDSAPFTYCDFRPGDGRLGSSGGRYGRAGLARRDAHYHRQLAEAARHWLPELAHVEPSHAWAVDIAVASDMVPHLRPLSERAPGQAIEGLGALGVLPGMLLGRRAGEAMARRLGELSTRTLYASPKMV